MLRRIAFMALTLLAAAPALAQEAPYRMYAWHGGWGMMLFGPLFMILIVAGIVALAVWLLRGGAQPPATPGRNSVDILKERFARGEIDKTEFEERRKILER
jgi:putative membrane protein